MRDVTLDEFNDLLERLVRDDPYPSLAAPFTQALPHRMLLFPVIHDHALIYRLVRGLAASVGDTSFIVTHDVPYFRAAGSRGDAKEFAVEEAASETSEFDHYLSRAPEYRLFSPSLAWILHLTREDAGVLGAASAELVEKAKAMLPRNLDVIGYTTTVLEDGDHGDDISWLQPLLTHVFSEQEARRLLDEAEKGRAMRAALVPPKVYVSLVRDGLRELASESLQMQLWLSADDPSSFGEAFCQTYDDSGLSTALEKSEAAEYLGAEAVEPLQQLGRALSSMDESQTVESLIASDGMATVRELAKAALDAMNGGSGTD